MRTRRVSSPSARVLTFWDNVRRYHGKLLIKPSKVAIRRIRERLRTEMWALRGANAQAVIKRLNPIIRGWAAYYRTVVSSEVFTSLDSYVWTLTYKWAKHSHPGNRGTGSLTGTTGCTQDQTQPMGVRRPQKRRSPPEVRLDQDRPTPDGQTPSVT